MSLRWSQKRIVGMVAVIFGLAAVSACTDDPSSSEQATSEQATAFRCRASLPAGGCYSLPADCPVTVPHEAQPHCPLGAELISAADDDCAQKLICTD